MRANASQNNGRADGFGDIVGRTQLKATYFVAFFTHGRTENHGNMAEPGVSLHFLAEFVATLAGHHHIEKREVWNLFLQICKGIGP